VKTKRHALTLLVLKKVILGRTAKTFPGSLSWLKTKDRKY